MTNLTLAIDEAILRNARKVALDRTDVLVYAHDERKREKASSLILAAAERTRCTTV